MDEYEYLKELDINGLVEIIERMDDFEETQRALNLLESREFDKALELGIDILKNNKGDDFLQAAAWDFLFYDGQDKIIAALEAREAPMGKTLLDDVMHDLVCYELEEFKGTSFVALIKKTYESLSDSEKDSMTWHDDKPFYKMYFESE